MQVYSGRVGTTADAEVFVARVDTPIGVLHVASVAGGVCIAVFDERPECLVPRLHRAFGSFFHVAAGDPLAVEARLRRYFDGEHDALRDVPLAAPATPMQRRVWSLVSDLPPGTLATYLALANRLGMPRAQRAVGVCLASNPVPLLVPCHRVVAASGMLASHPGGAARKDWLLRHEGALGIADLTTAQLVRQRLRRAAQRRRLAPGETVGIVALPLGIGS
jgi:methylated-DNA-[protein]-cysteine S-methyltransferase